MLRKALVMPSSFWYTTRGPRRWRKRRLRILPLPARMRRVALTRSMSAKAPCSWSTLTASLVFLIDWTSFERTSGISPRPETRWPRARTRGVIAVAASADVVA
eukprot:Amastigsp_a841264_1820.p5 type:complete len:103 gc:universal Amastigsp_a841264_1820:711-403(-)